MRTWTEKQTDAINAREGTVIVSAAAGSGKTSVLVERLIQRLTDEKKPSSADRILVVTYTNAAAKEMKERVESVVADLVEKDPMNKNLQKQQMLIPSMNISTVHSFCSKLLKEHFQKVNIPYDYKIISDKQREEMINQAVRKVVSDSFENGDYSLANNFSNEKNDRNLFETIVKLYDFANAHLFPEDWLDQTCEKYRSDVQIEKSEWGKDLIFYARKSLEMLVKLSKYNLNIISGDETLVKAYATAIEGDVKQFEDLLEVFKNGTWDNICQKIASLKIQTLKPVKGEDELKEQSKTIRAKVKKDFESLKNLFENNEEECREILEKMEVLVKSLAELTKEFTKEFTKLKRNKKFVDYGDLEHLTIELLLEKDENSNIIPSKIAIEISQGFDEIMIDEYQDTNQVQDWIFRSISKADNNKFMVGDLKQCIYSFRQAMPEIFIGYKESFKRYDRDKNEYPATIVLDQNFRSRKNVIDSVNFIFSSLMSKNAGGVDYVGDEALSQGAVYEDGENYETELVLLQQEKKIEAKIPMQILEARHIAKSIKTIIESGLLVGNGENRRAVTYKDFAILLRTANKFSQTYASVLEENGVPAKAQVERPFFEASEVVQVLAFLQVIDNPNQDVALLSVLMGPVYGFSASSLAKFRKANKKESVYISLIKDETGVFDDFLQDIEDYRLLATHLPSQVFIDTLFQKTGYLDLVSAMQSGKARLANLRLLRQYASDYENSGYRGINAFVSFLDKLVKNKSNMEGASLSADFSDAVQIMSIHKSKGLEFPVCFVAGCGRKIRIDNSDLVLNSELGIGISLKDEITKAKYSNFIRDAIKMKNKMDEISEELRVLYVATTRAREKLIFVATLNDIEAKLSQYAALMNSEKNIDENSVKSVRSIADWLIMCALKHPNGNLLRNMAKIDDSIVNYENFTAWNMSVNIGLKHLEKSTVDNSDIDEDVEIDSELFEKIKEKLNFKYANEKINQIPAKVTASAIAHKQAGKDIILKRPAFLSESGLTPAERGTAVHNFLQFCDMKRALTQPEKEVQRLVEEGFITKEQGEVVNFEKVKNFLNSNIGQRIVNSEEFYRERRFSSKISASLVNEDFPSETKIILQGAVDCAFFENEKLYIVDFKTDRVNDPQELVDLYGIQLKLYATALEQVNNCKIGGSYLYSFHLNKAIEV